MKKAIIIEDAPQGIKNLRTMLRIVAPEVKVIGTAKSIKEGIRLLSRPEVEPDVAFLDIRLEDGLVFRLLNQLEEVNFEVIFVTAFDQYTKQACDFSSIGYIHKPIDPDELRDAIARIRPHRRYWSQKRLESFRIHQSQAGLNEFSPLVLSDTGGYQVVSLKDIMYLQGCDNCTMVYLEDGRRFLITKHLKLFEKLHNLYFHRIHQSFMVNLRFVTFVSRGDSGVVRLKEGTELAISKLRKPLFLLRLKQYQIENLEL
ncbi:MAG: DNA-binding response regulator [Bacteroidetes bacterium]|nr:MAG: DNA-binding response regulator [Bacteroidota bacterium]